MRDEHFDRQAPFEGGHWWFAARRNIVGRILNHLVPPDRGHLVIDVGCGTGAMVSFLGRQYRAVGSDPSVHAVALARTRWPDAEIRHGLLPAALQDLAGSPRAVLLMDVLEHVPNDRALVHEALRLLPDGGYLLVTVPADVGVWGRHDVTLGHYRRYDTASLRALWSGLDADELLVSHFNHRLAPVVRAVRALGARTGWTFGSAGLDLSLRSRAVNAILYRIFTGEGERLVRAVGGRGPGYDSGVSLIAVLEKRQPAPRRPAG